MLRFTLHGFGLRGLHGEVVRGPASWFKPATPIAPAAPAPASVPAARITEQSVTAELANRASAAILRALQGDAELGYPDGAWSAGKAHSVLLRAHVIEDASPTATRFVGALLAALAVKGYLDDMSERSATKLYALAGTRPRAAAPMAPPSAFDTRTVMRGLPRGLVPAGTRVDIEGIPYRVLTEIDVAAHDSTRGLVRSWLLLGPGGSRTRLDLESGGGHHTRGQTGVGMSGPRTVWHPEDVELGFRGQAYDDSYFVGERQQPGRDFLFVYEVKGNVTAARLGKLFPTGWSVIRGAGASCDPDADCVTVAASTQWPAELRGSHWQPIGTLSAADVRARQVENYRPERAPRDAARVQPGAYRFEAGTVVRFNNPRERRRYVVACRDVVLGPESDRYNLVALTGGMRGSAPTSVSGADLVRDADQTVDFVGHWAGHLRARFGSMRQQCAYWARETTAR